MTQEDKETLKRILKENLSASVKRVCVGGGFNPFYEITILFDNEEILHIKLKNGFATEH